MEQTLLLAKGSMRADYTEIRASAVPLSQLVRDFYASVTGKVYWLYSSWIDILLSYRSTILGPLWIPIGNAVFVFAVGSLYGRVVLTHGSNIYLAYLAVGVTLFYFTSQSVTGSTFVFLANKSDILDGASTYTDVILKLITKNFIYLLHNSFIVFIAIIVSKIAMSLAALLILVTLPLVLLNLVWMCVILSILGARYPDLEELLRSAMRLMFFLTPILWIPHQHGAVVDALLYLNPFYYFLEAIRTPLLYGQVPYFEIGMLIAALPIGWVAASLLYARTRHWVALWL
jgi:homopolymeric O-antigen transport system permease protein